MCLFCVVLACVFLEWAVCNLEYYYYFNCFKLSVDGCVLFREEVTAINDHCCC